MNKHDGHSENWSALPAEAVLRHFESSSTGLNDADAARRLAQYGPNGLPSAKQRSVLFRFLLQFHNVLIYVLLAASAVSAVLGQWVDTGVIIAVVLINAAIGLTLIVQALFTYAPWMQALFGTAGLGLIAWAHIVTAGVALFVIVEIEKAAFRYAGWRVA